MKRQRLKIGFPAACLAFLLILSGCGANETGLPKQQEERYESAENAFGARYRLTVDEMTDALNKALSTTPLKPDADSWEIAAEGLSDSGGTLYSVYAVKKGNLTLSVAAEDQSRKALNLSVGCVTVRLEDGEFRKTVIATAAKAAACAGGYKQEATAFFEELFSSLFGEWNAFTYDGALYLKTENEGITTLLIVPCSEEAAQNQYAPDFGDYQQQKR